MDDLAERAPRQGELLSTEAVRLAVKVTGGPTFWFLWGAGSGQELMPLPTGILWGMDSISTSLPGRSIELDARLLEETLERWRETPQLETPRRHTNLGRRLSEIRDRIKASGQPLLSWEEIDRELADRRGERHADLDR